MKTKSKFLLALTTLTIAAASLVTGMTLIASAEETQATPALYIESYNLSFRDNLCIKYAVRTENVTAEEKLLVWTEEAVAEFDSEDDYVLGTQSRTLTSVGYQVIDEVQCDIFDLTDVYAKQMTEIYYARAYVEQDDTVYYSSVVKYSIAQYAHDIKAVSDNEKLIDLVEKTLDYGAATQTYLDYKTEWLANAEAYTVSIEGGVLPDGTTKGFYKAGTTVNAIHDAPEEFKVFSGWLNSAGEKVLEITVSKDDTFTAVFVPYGSKGLTYELNSDEKSYTVTGMGTCTSEYLVIPSIYNDLPVTGIKSTSFVELSDLNTVVIPDSIKSIGERAFCNCTSLKYITVGNGIEYVGENAFYNCPITNYTQKNSLKFIGNTSNPYIILMGTTNNTLTEYIIPEETKIIYDYAFYYCKNLTSVDLSNITSIGIYSFNLSGLTSVVIPDSMIVVGRGAFENCSKLESVVISDNTSIGDCLFAYCSSLSSVKLPAGLTTIGDSMFSNCTSLKSIDIPSGVTTIKYSVFSSSGLESIILPDGVETLGKNVFKNCASLSSIVIPESLISIDDSCFLSCTALQSVYYKGTAEQWENISLSDNNEILKEATVYFYSENAIDYETEALYWHFDENGNVVVW